jgi:subtilisin family serine protease
LEKSSFSNYGERVTIAAPGENIRALGFNQEIGVYNGTSEAAPIVAGIISFLMAHGYTAKDIDSFLIPYNSFFQI